jgi:hypothetical protein
VPLQQVFAGETKALKGLPDSIYHYLSIGTLETFKSATNNLKLQERHHGGFAVNEAVSKPRADLEHSPPAPTYLR